MSNDGLRVAVGLQYYEYNGAVITIYNSGSNDWINDGFIESPVGSATRFGAAVSISSVNGNKLFVGAPNMGPANKGYVAAYTFTQGVGWGSPQELIYPGSPPADSYYGQSVSISSNGNFMLIGTRTRIAISYQFLTFPYFNSANVNIQGSAWVSNAILTQNVYTTTLNAVTMNTTSLTSTGLKIGNDISQGSFAITGNVYASNSVALSTGNVYANVYLNTLNVAVNMNVISLNVTQTPFRSTINVNSINLFSIYQTDGIKTPVTATQNAFASNTLSGSNLSVTNTIYYNEDLTKRSLYLYPNSDNAPAIQSAISATCNASAKSYWCTSPAPVYANIVSGSSSSNAYSGGVLVPDGRIIFVTSNCSNIGIFNPSNFSFTLIPNAPPGFNGGVLLPNGNVLFVPQVSNVAQFNPVTSEFSNVGTSSFQSSSWNGVLGPDGVWLTPCQYRVPGDPSVIGLYNYDTNYASCVYPIEQLTKLSVSGPSGTTRSGTSVAWSYSLKLFVSISYEGNSFYSSDGKTWTLTTGTKLSTVDAGCFWWSVAWSEAAAIFVATGMYGSLNSAWSTDGLNWNAPTGSSLYSVDFSVQWTSVTYNTSTNTFCAIGNGSTYSRNSAVSTNGKYWYNSYGGAWNFLSYFGIYWESVSFLGSEYFAVGQGTDCFARSFDGMLWDVPGYNPTLSSIGSFWSSIAVAEEWGFIVAIGGLNSYNSAYLGYNPYLAWWPPSPSLYDVDPSCAWRDVAWAKESGCFLAVGVAGTVNSAYSPNGRSWYPIRNPSLYDISTGTPWLGSAWSNSLGLYAIVGDNPGAYAYAPPPNNGSLLVPSGNVLFSPVGSANVMEYQPFSTPSNIVIGTDRFNGLVLAPNGNVITVPSGSNICVIDLVGRRSTNVGPITGSSASNFFKGGALLPSGNIVFAPGTSGNVGMFDPVRLTYSNSTSSGTSGIAFSGATLIPSGQVVFTPSDSANVGILDSFTSVAPEFCLAPYFNKF
jgi:hypothetical protein